MPANPTPPGFVAPQPGKTDLTVAAGQTVDLSPTAAQYKQFYQQIHPQTIDQVRQVLGFSAASNAALLKAKTTPVVRALSLKPIAVAALQPTTAAATLAATRISLYNAGAEYVSHPDPSSYSAWVPALNQYIAQSGAVLNVIGLQNITVNNGATLTISKDTHALYANNIVVHGTGRIVCKGKLTFKINSLEGTTGTTILKNPVVTKLNP
ncbi:MAG: hypothetical protein ABSG41_16705 [Bryobacteraceae bacterium]|jgi:hypothetical protein